MKRGPGVAGPSFSSESAATATEPSIGFLGTEVRVRDAHDRVGDGEAAGATGESHHSCTGPGRQCRRVRCRPAPSCIWCRPEYTCVSLSRMPASMLYVMATTPFVATDTVTEPTRVPLLVSHLCCTGRQRPRGAGHGLRDRVRPAPPAEAVKEEYLGCRRSLGERRLVDEALDVDEKRRVVSVQDGVAVAREGCGVVVPIVAAHFA